MENYTFNIHIFAENLLIKISMFLSHTTIKGEKLSLLKILKIVYLFLNNIFCNKILLASYNAFETFYIK